jgi:hypothetical protein
MKILNNGKIIYPHAREFLFEHPNQGDGYRLRAYMEGANGFTSQGVDIPLMSDTAWSKILRICQYMFLKFYWTGADEIIEVDSALQNLLNRDSNASLNGGKGPHYICSTITDIARSILSAYGIQSMRVGGTTFSGGGDVTIVVYCPEYSKWVWIQPQTLSYVLLTDGAPASPIELESYYRKGLSNLLTFKSGTSTIETNTGYDRYHGTNGNWWRGNLADVQYGGYFYKCSYMNSETKRPVSILSSVLKDYEILCYIQGKTPVNGARPTGVDDIFPTVNNIAIVSIYDDNGLKRFEFAHNMLSFKEIQKSTDGSTWVALTDMSDVIDGTGIGSIYYKAVSIQGIPSNIIEFQY